jgi:hypothetical protein
MALKPIEKGESTSFGEKEAPERQVRCLNRLMEVLLPPAEPRWEDLAFWTTRAQCPKGSSPKDSKPRPGYAPAAREFLDSGFVTFPLISTRRFNSPGESMFAFVRELSSSSEYCKGTERGSIISELRRARSRTTARQPPAAHMQEGMAERIDEVVCNHALLFPAAMHLRPPEQEVLGVKYSTPKIASAGFKQSYLERQDDRELRCDESAFADRPCDRGECLGRAKRMAMGHDRRFFAVPAIDLNMPARLRPSIRVMSPPVQPPHTVRRHLQEKAVVCVGRGPACELIADNICRTGIGMLEGARAGVSSMRNGRAMGTDCWIQRMQIQQPRFESRQHTRIM